MSDGNTPRRPFVGFDVVPPCPGAPRKARPSPGLFDVSDDAPVRRLSFGMGADPAGAPGSAPGTPSRRLLPREDEEQRQPQQAQAQQLQHHNHDLQQRQQQQQQAAGAAPQHADAAPRDSPKMSRVLQQSQDPNALELASPTPPMRFGGLPAAKRPRTTATPVRLFR